MEARGEPEVRPATPTDAARLAEIRTAMATLEPSGTLDSLIFHEVDFLDRLAIPHGEDYFCLVGEVDDRILGYVIGGGSRDLDHKAHGEIYELGVEPGPAAAAVGLKLLETAISSFESAAFAGTLLSAAETDGVLRDLARAAGMSESPTTPGHVRYVWVPRS